MDIKAYLATLTPADRVGFATRCNTTIGHLKNVAGGYRPCSPELAIEIDRESGGKVPCETSCPGADWAYIRNAASPRVPSRQCKTA